MTGSSKGARRALFVVAIVVISIGAAQAVLGAIDSGITVDEPTHVDRTRNWIEHGWYVPSFLLDGDQPADSEQANPALYGPAFAALVQGATFAAGLGPIDEVVTTAGGWTVRHLLTAMLGLATALVAGLGVFAISRSNLFALWTTAALIATPIWLGMSFFNPKDIPVAAGYTFVTVGLVMAISLARSERRRRVLTGLAVAALIGSGTYLAVGTRLAMWLPLAAAALVYLAIVLGSPRAVRLRELGIGYVAGGFAAGAASLLAIYPAVFTDPLTALVDSVSGSSNFQWTGFTLTAGRLLDETPPLWYLPGWTIASVPLGVLLLATAALSLAAVQLSRAARSGGRGGMIGRVAAIRSAPVALVGLQALMLPVASAVVGATMYTGIRQFLFMVPALAMLAGIGAAWLWRASARWRGGRWQPAAALALGLVLVLPMVEQTILFPYNYTYITPLAGIGGVNDRWETDYWWASSREAYAQVPGDRQPRCIATAPTWKRNGSIDAPSCMPGYANYFGPFAAERSLPSAGDEEAKWVLTRHRAGNDPVPGCDPGPSVTRWLRGERVVMSYVMRCPKAPVVKGSAGPLDETDARAAQR